MSAWLATIRETFDIWISSRDADDASASAFASGESTLARISFELSRNSISISIKWFYSESNAATRRRRWPNQQQRQQRTNTFESDAPIQAQNSRRLLVWVNQRAATSKESERASTTAIPHLCVCEQWLRQRRHLQIIECRLPHRRQHQRSLLAGGVCTGWTLCWTRLNS